MLALMSNETLSSMSDTEFDAHCAAIDGAAQDARDMGVFNGAVFAAGDAAAAEVKTRGGR